MTASIAIYLKIIPRILNPYPCHTKQKKLSGQVSVSRFYSEEIIPPVDFHNTTRYSQAEEFTVNGLTVFVIDQGDFCSIAYQDNLTQYMMYLNTDFASAIEIAKTISDTES